METMVIVGGSSGIGRAVASANAAAGRRSVVVGRSKESLDRVASEGEDAIVGLVADAGRPADLEAAFETIGKFDHLVLTAAGGQGAGALADLSTEDLRRGFDEKFWLYWNALKTAPARLAPTGSITLVGAARSRMADADSVGLAAINGALDAMVPSLAKGLAPIRVNLVAPGVIDTPPWAALAESDREAAFAEIGGRTLAGRVGQPAEVADAILSVALNPYITGTILEVDGGLRL